MTTWKGKGYECDPADLDHDAGQWESATTALESAKSKAAAQASGLPDFGSHFSAVKATYKEMADAVSAHLKGGVDQVTKVDDTIRANKSQYDADQRAASQNVTDAGKGDGGGGGGGGGGDQGGGGGGKYKGKLEGQVGEWDPQPPKDPENPNDPKDDKIYDKLEEMVNGLLEDDGIRLNALDTNDAFAQSEETVDAYTDADGKIHVISTNPNQGTHATDMTVSFLDEEGNMHVVTSVAGQMVEDTTTSNGTTLERRVVQQGTLDQMMAEAKEVSISYTDDKGAEHVVSTDKDQGGQMNQVVVAYADENGEQRMVSDEKGIDAPVQQGFAATNVAFAPNELSTPQFQKMTQPTA